MSNDFKIHLLNLAVAVCILLCVATVPRAQAILVPVGTEYCNVYKQSAGNANSQRNGAWDAGDNTGNTRVDEILDSLYALIKGNPAALSALESVAAAVKAGPEKYLDGNCAIKKPEFRQLVLSKGAGSGFDFATELDKLLNPRARKRSS